MITVLHLITSLHSGGAGRLLATNVAALRDETDVESHVAYLTPPHPLVEELRQQGFEPHFLDHRRRLDLPRTVARIARIARRRHVDLIHTHLFLDRLAGGLAAALLGLPLVTTLHTGGEGQALGWRHRLEDLLARRWTDRFLAVSEAVARFQIDQRALPPERVEVLRSGIDVERFATPPSAPTRQALLRELNLEDRGPVLLQVGRLTPEKGQDTILAALPRLMEAHPRLCLVLVGGGGARRSLEQFADRLGVASAVRFAGDRSDVPDLLHLADGFVFPSRPGEGLGLALVEAMAAGLPVVASRLPSLAEVVEDGITGRLVPVDDPDALATAWLDILGHPDGAHRLGNAARDSIRRRFSAPEVARRLASVYHSVLRESPP